MSRKTWMWVLGALLGIAITAGITWAASQLTGQHIGLSSEPLSAGRQLAPKQAEHRSGGGEGTRSAATTTTTASTTGGGATSTATATATSTREHQGPDD